MFLTIFLVKFVFRVGFGRAKGDSFVLLLGLPYSLRFFDEETCVCKNICRNKYFVALPVVPHKAVAEVSRIGNYRRDWLL